MIYTLFQLFTDTWHLARKYEFRKHGPDIEMLYRDIFRAVQAYYERRNHEDTENNM